MAYSRNGCVADYVQVNIETSQTVAVPLEARKGSVFELTHPCHSWYYPSPVASPAQRFPGLQGYLAHKK